MYKLKQLPEDFLVRELSTITPCATGDYAYFTLKKKNTTTIDALQTLADVFHIPLKHLGCAGNKDKHALTEQVCSIKNSSRAQLEHIHLKNIHLTYLGQGDTPVSLGNLTSNHFTIVVRNIQKLPLSKTAFINYFGEQRFSTNNASIGKYIIQKKFGEACASINDDAIQKHLTSHPHDFLGALKTLPLKIIKLYIHAYQAHLWNLLALENLSTQVLPIIGFGTPLTPLVAAILKRESINLRDFIIKPFPELSSEGGERNVFVEAHDLQIGTLEPDELNSGMKKVTLTFILPKGSYATEFIRQLFSQ